MWSHQHEQLSKTVFPKRLPYSQETEKDKAYNNSIQGNTKCQKEARNLFSPWVIKSVWQKHFVCNLMVAGGKWWDLKVGFNIAHSQSLCMDSRQDFGENLLTKGSMDAFDGIFHACLKLAFQFFSFNHPLQTNLGIQDAFFFRLCLYILSPLILNQEFPSLILNQEFYSPSVPSTCITFVFCTIYYIDESEFEEFNWNKKSSESARWIILLSFLGEIFFNI